MKSRRFEAVLVAAAFLASPAWTPAAQRVIPDEQDRQELERASKEVRADPSSRDARWRLAFLLYRIGDLVGAREQFLEAERMHGASGYGSLMIGVIAETQLRYREAIDLYERALELEARDTAVARQASQNLERLRAHLQDLARYRAADERIRRDLAIALATMGVSILLVLRVTVPRGRAVLES